MIKVLSRKVMIEEARDNFTKQYSGYPRNHKFMSGRTVYEHIRDLRRLDTESCTYEDLVSVIDKSWLDNCCHECGRAMETLVLFAHAQVRICPDCLHETIRLLW